MGRSGIVCGQLYQRPLKHQLFMGDMDQELELSMDHMTTLLGSFCGNMWALWTLYPVSEVCGNLWPILISIWTTMIIKNHG